MSLSTLCNLPLELFDFIVGDLELNALKRFRLSCKLANQRANKIMWSTIHIDFSGLKYHEKAISQLPFTRIDHSWILQGGDSPFALHQRFYQPCIYITGDRIADFADDLISGDLNSVLSNVNELSIDIPVADENDQNEHTQPLINQLIGLVVEQAVRVKKIDMYLHCNTASEVNLAPVSSLFFAYPHAVKNLQLTGNEIPTNFYKLILNCQNVNSIVIGTWGADVNYQSIVRSCFGHSGMPKLPQSIQLFELETRFWPMSFTLASSQAVQQRMKMFLSNAPGLKVLSMPRFSEESIKLITGYEWMPPSVETLDWHNDEIPPGDLSQLTDLRLAQCNLGICQVHLPNLKKLRVGSVQDVEAFRSIVQSSNKLNCLDIHLPSWELGKWKGILDCICEDAQELKTLILDARVNDLALEEMHDTFDNFLHRQGEPRNNNFDADITVAGRNNEHKRTIPSLRKLYVHCNGSLDQSLKRFLDTLLLVFPHLELLLYAPATFGPSIYPVTHYSQTCFRFQG